MLTIEKSYKILNLVNKYHNINDVIIIQGDQFSFYTDSLGSVITIKEKFKKDSWTNFMYDYLKTNLDLDSNKYMFYDFLEAFNLLHEIGHSLQNNKDKYNDEYKIYKNKTYKDNKEAYTIYRNLTLEKDADLFASGFIKDHKFEIWSIMNDITVDEAIEEYNFWNI